MRRPSTALALITSGLLVGSSLIAATAQATVPDTATTGTDGAAPSAMPARTIDELLALGRPIVLAHTAGEDAYPGSTMYGFTESVKAGVDMLDLNVVLTKDGVLAVQHDLTVDRTTDGTGEVAAMTFDQVHQLDNAYWFTPDCGVCGDQPDASYVWRGVRTGAVPPPAGYTADDFAIPSLDELIAAFPGVPLNIELKGKGPAAATAAEALVKVLTDTNMLDRVVVTSFDDATVDVFRDLAPTVELSPGLDASTKWVLGRTPLPHGMRILQLPPQYNGLQVITPEMVAASHDAGYLIWIWPNDRTLENLAAYRLFIAGGIDGLNINFPAEGVAAVQQ